MEVFGFLGTVSYPTHLFARAFFFFFWMVDFGLRIMTHSKHVDHAQFSVLWKILTSTLVPIQVL